MTLTDKELDWIRKNTINFDDDIVEQLQDPEFQKMWLEISLEEFLQDGNVDVFLRALTYVVKARGRGEVSRLAKVTKIDRSNLSEIINGKKTPHLDTALKILNGLGYTFDIKLKSA